MSCDSLDGLIPVVDSVAAVLIGDVIIGPGYYVCPLAALRGNFDRIILEEGVNLQDTCDSRVATLWSNATVQSPDLAARFAMASVRRGYNGTITARGTHERRQANARDRN